MAFRHGRFADITVDGNDLSDFCDSADINISVDTAETTTFGDSWKTNIAGLAGATLALSGNYDPTATTGPAAVLTSLVGADPVAVVLYPGGNASGQISHSFNAILTGYTEKAAVGDKVTFTANLLVDGQVTTANV
jgi:hypothetical protein